MPRTPRFRPTLGPVACDWIEEYLVHGPGDIQGAPIVLDDEFRAFIYRCYELHPRGHPEAGRRAYRRAFLSRSKGRAKSELAGMLACYEALGPCRFDGWDANGDPVGAEITSPIVRCYATEQGQAGNTYDNVFYMLQNGLVFDEYPGLDVGLTRTFLPETGDIQAVSSAAGSKDGGKETFAVFDETHLWILASYKQLHGTVTRNLLKRKAGDGWALETSTMYAPGEDSVAEETHKTSKSVDTILFDHKQAPAGVDIHDDAAVLEALRYVYGPAAEWMDLTGLLNEFHDTQNRESDLRRYWFNEPWTTEEKFTTPNAWQALYDVNVTIDRGDRVVLGLDGSYNNDSTALTIVKVGAGKPHLAVADVWEKPAQAPPGWEVDILDVEERIRQCRLEYNVLELVADPYRWDRTLQVMEDEGCTVVKFPQNAGRMTPATSRFSDLVASGTMTQDGNEALERHVLNAIMVSDSRGKRLKKESKASANKIDLAVSGLMALDRAASYTDSGYATVLTADDLDRLARSYDDPDAPDQEPEESREPRTGFRIVPQEETTFVRYDPSRGIGVG